MGKAIVLGLGDNTDYEIVWSAPTIEKLVADFHIAADEIDPDIPIESERDLVVSILGFLRSGSGGERYVASPDIVEGLARSFRMKVTVGGTSIRAAIAMRRLGYVSALHLVTMNDYVRHQLPEGCEWVCSAREDASYPHLIVQYNEGAEIRVGDTLLKAARPNRLIYNNDPDNMRMELSPRLGELAADARVLLVSGFNAMQDRELLAKRLDELSEVLAGLPEGALTFYEDACFHDSSMNAQVLEALLGKIDILSMNEDEARGYLGFGIDELGPRELRPALEKLHAALPGPTLVVHTRRWALASGKNAERFEAALRAGVVMATTRLRYGDDFDAARCEETAALPHDEDGAAFADGLKGGRDIACVPSFSVPKGNFTTIGLGDAFVGGFLPASIE